MRYLALSMLLACGNPANHPTDAALDAHVCAAAPEGLPMCSTTCGNGQLDECYVTHPPGGESVDPCYHYVTQTEVCDGAMNALTCAADGYYGGSAACSAQCAFEDRGCTACATGARVQRCDATAVTSAGDVVPSGAGSGAPRVVVGGAIVELAAQGVVQIASLDKPALLGTPAGWLAAVTSTTSLSLTAIDLDGNQTAGATILASSAVQVYGAHGPTNRNLVAWIVPNGGWELWFAIVDDAGAVVNTPARLASASNLTSASVSSDGTAFFVGYGGGSLARIAGDGTVTGTTTGFPTGTTSMFGWLPVTVRADASGGWYIVANETATQSFTVQRFDAQGALQGSPATVTPNGSVAAGAFVADGAKLAMGVGVSMVNAVAAQQLEWVDATGNVVDSVEIGRGPGWPLVARLGTGFVAAFQGAGVDQLAVVTP